MVKFDTQAVLRVWLRAASGIEAVFEAGFENLAATPFDAVDPDTGEKFGLGIGGGFLGV
jgi:hypothetical protein